MIDFQSVREHIQELLFESKKKIVALCVILIFMTLCAVILLSVQVSAPEKKGGALSDSDRKLVIDQPLVVPESPASPDGYSTARKTPERWSGKDVEKWFTVPDRTEIEALGRANDRRIEEIIGAAP